jgi:hypothetical protein
LEGDKGENNELARTVKMSGYILVRS